MAKQSAALKMKPPPTGEQTKRQVIGDVASFWGQLPLFEPAPPGKLATYRQMQGNPTVALARVAAKAPIRAAKVMVEAKDEAPDDAECFIQEHVDRLWPSMIKGALACLDFGWTAFEKIYEIRDGRYTLARLKPLLHDITKANVDKDSGQFHGLKQQEKIALGPEKCVWIMHDAEPGNWYGRSRHENIRENAWWPWQETMKKTGQFVTKVSGVIPMIEYPPGESRDRHGDLQDNFQIAEATLRQLGSGMGVTMPNIFAPHAGDLARSGVNLAELKAWHISFLETKGNPGPGLSALLRHFESLMVRGWLVPERAVIEGQYGTKAEAGEHAALGLTIADLFLGEIIEEVNRQIVDPLLVINFGREAERSVYVGDAGQDPALRALFGDLVKTALAAPANVDLFLKYINVEAILDSLGLPKEEQPEPEGEGEPEPEPEPTRRPAIPPGTNPEDVVSSIVKSMYQG